MDGLVLGRIGHYFDAGNGSCSTALVVDVIDVGGKVGVNVKAWHGGGEEFTRTSVLHSGSPSKSDEISSFHLNRDCPWGR